jgi:hypothetical protein
MLPVCCPTLPAAATNACLWVNAIRPRLTGLQLTWAGPLRRRCRWPRRTVGEAAHKSLSPPTGS